MKFKIARTIAMLLLIVAVFCALYMHRVSQAQAELLFYVFVVLAVLGGVILFVFYRCPYCKQRFPLGKHVRTTKCPHCGKDLGTPI